MTKSKQNFFLMNFKCFFIHIMILVFISCSKDKTNSCIINPSYDVEVSSIMNAYCIACHQTNNASGGVNLDDKNLVEQHINQIILEIESQSMPPYGMPAPTDLERDSIIVILNCWLENVVR